MTEIEVPIKTKIEKLLSKGRVMLMLRGVPSFPLCKGSKRIMDVLSKYNIPKLEYFDLTTDEEIAKHLLLFSNFGEIPQLYIESKLVGGCEVVESLEAQGLLQKLLLN